MTREIWAREHLVSFLAGGLTTEERFEIQEQLKTDANLAGDLDELRGFDERMRKLFIASKPPLALEDRVIQSLRKRTTSSAMRAGAWKWPARGIAAAATLLVIVLGGAIFVTQLGGPGLQMSSNGQLSMNLYQEATTDIDPGVAESEFNYKVDLNAILTPRFSTQAADIASTTDGKKTKDKVTRDAGDALEEKLGKEIEDLTASRTWSDGASTRGNSVDGARSEALKQSGAAPQFGFDAYSSNKNHLKPLNGRATLDLPTAPPDGRQSGLSGSFYGRSGAVKEKESEPQRQSAPNRPASALPPPPGFGVSSPQLPPVLMSPQGGAESAGVSQPAKKGGVIREFRTPVQAAAQNWYSPADAFKEMTKGDGGRKSRFGPLAGLGFIADPKDEMSASTPNGGTRYNVPMNGTPAAQSPAMDDQVKVGNKVLAGDIKNSATRSTPQDKDEDGEGKKLTGLQSEPAKPGDPNKTPPPPAEKASEKVDPKLIEPKQPPTVRRVVIRSGEIEFEVDSFDQAVGIIYKVIGQTKGGIISTTNSDKLDNGKMRGAVVVRMPPEELDEFIAALRRDLGKFAELKNQRIGSQDVTKQYTDMESELRGLRVSEERLIVMLKDTKGQLKDLLAVETQLAKTRTSIERIEGELRYYANLAAMSTLTINLHEKEIRIAAGVVESERVQAGVEAEDVDAAFQAAKAAIDEFKGRVMHSEMKQKAAGQFTALLQFEISPDSAGLMRDRLKQIGTVARLEIDRVQKVEGGGAANRDSKVKRGDTQFFVSIYNLANVEPRETVIATVVGSDVPASYQKIRDLVAQVKGNLRNTSLQNSDARNVIAVLDFDIRRADEPAIQTALAAAGEFLTRRVERKAQTDNVTDTKVLFAVRLVSVGGITARESNNLSLAALDVPSSYRKVRDAVVKAKGTMRNANLQETDRANITATLDFDVLRTDEDAIVAALAGAGEILMRRVERRPESENVTDAKIGFVVSMVSVASINARETTHLQIAATDVPAAFAKLREAAAKAKAQIRTANLQENDRENMTATLEFDVLRTDEDAVLTALTAAGEQLKRQVDRQANGANVTDAKVLFKIDLVSASGIEPREVYVLVIKVDKVEEKLKVFQALVSEARGRVVTGPLKKKTSNGKMEATISYDVPLMSAGAVAEMFKNAGNVAAQNEEKNPKAPEGKLALARFRVTLFDAEPLVPNDEGFGAQLRNGMSVGLRGLSLTASYLILALVIVGPWLLVAWVVYVLARRTFGRSAATVVSEAPNPVESTK